jgi:hypothetical protein
MELTYGACCEVQTSRGLTILLSGLRAAISASDLHQRFRTDGKRRNLADGTSATSNVEVLSDPSDEIAPTEAKGTFGGGAVCISGDGTGMGVQSREGGHDPVR